MVARALGLLFAAARAAVPADRVASLPGFDEALPEMYSGYIQSALPGGGSAWTHYWLVFAPKATRVAVWQQGGPGGSSLIGLLTENGPITLNDASFSTQAYAETGVPTVFENPHSWHTTDTTMLYIEHPAPTGFSYCGRTGVDCALDDDSQADLAYANYVTFFTDMYPELATLPLYFTGESYAGVLVPTLALRLLDRRNETNRLTAPWNVAGFALGNDCPGNHVFTCTPYSGWAGTEVSVEFLYGHGMIPPAKKQEVDEACGDWYVREPPGPQGPPPDECARLLEDKVRPLKSIAGDTYDMGGGYFLYDSCGADLLHADDSGVLQARAAKVPTEFAETAGEYACGQENAATLWLNLPAVQAALHVRLVGKREFALSTRLDYDFTMPSLLAAYNDTLVRELRILQFSGDADPCVPYVGTARWIESLRMPVVKAWRPWTAPQTMAVTGYVTTYDTPGGGFTFATVRDAGHMVPRYKPKQAKHMMQRWLDGHDL
ncbi:peptidase S10, serine carboxypeptidase [Pelagophyceae sp. CCMP2097]|nr:peptidase S10, serine carboxypeptidase [Pelagophyceae sp. CCMP2097]|mmetsp:Transcript_22127/g.76040  ORF Transcript_22127/g.76040 Transcript_22127/m.76040 type:complete len:491 (-) Transcript_22127:212-1684(-)